MNRRTTDTRCKAVCCHAVFSSSLAWPSLCLRGIQSISVKQPWRHQEGSSPYSTLCQLSTKQPHCNWQWRVTNEGNTSSPKIRIRLFEFFTHLNDVQKQQLKQGVLTNQWLVVLICRKREGSLLYRLRRKMTFCTGSTRHRISGWFIESSEKLKKSKVTFLKRVIKSQNSLTRDGYLGLHWT